MKSRYKTNLDMQQVFTIIIAASLILGVIIGSVLANTLPQDKYILLSKYINDYISTVPNQLYARSQIFIETFVKYEKIVVFIWLLAFIPTGSIVSLLIMLVKGMGFGFTTSFLVREFGFEGIFYASILYFIQNIFLIPAFFWVLYNNLAYSARNYNNTEKISEIFDKTIMAEYSLVLLTSSMFVVIASLIEAFVIPNIIF